ncbi:hypothetical protein KAR91_35860 [Candidatus Pacearchaeota archaeon]|nr:hypothetical protein [Candidatus Pacearchaeota archaeon]
MAEETKALIVVDEIDTNLVFGGAVEAVLNDLQIAYDSFKPDLTSAAGRALITKQCSRFAKTAKDFDGARLDIVADKKKALAKIDAIGKQIKDACKKYKDDTRLPFTEWETAEKARKLKIKLAAEFDKAFDDALVEYELREREAAVAAKEKEIAAEAERKRLAEKEEADKEEAKKEAKKETDAAAALEIEQLKAANLKAVREKGEAEDREKKAAKKKADDIAAASAKATADAKAEAERKAEEKRVSDKAEEDRLQAIANNKAHRLAVNEEILTSMLEQGFDEDISKQLIYSVSKGNITRMGINYGEE